MRRDYGISINWEEVHAIKHGLHDVPHHILGPHMEWDGVVINAYVKDALKVEVLHRDSDVSYEMRASGIADFFTLATDEKEIFPYRLRATYRDGSTYEYVDAYCFEPVIDNMELAALEQGIDYDSYKVLGAHKRTIDGVEGVLFAVWAPNAQRVSVVGEFNLWEGSRGLMRRLPNSAVFELFLPGIQEGTPYKYEIRTQDGRVFLKADPYASKNELAPADASIIADAKYRFRDGKWIKSRDKSAQIKKPLHIFEVNLAEFADKFMEEAGTYRSIAPVLCSYVKEMGYTHLELMPVMDTVNEASMGYETHGFYAVSGRFGEPEDLKYFVDYMHQHEVGVIFDWAPYQFGKEESGLYLFDGAPAYEDSNPLRAENPSWGTVAFNYGRKEVSNFLISNALYWVEEFHADGLRVASVASMLYLDYGRNSGEWLPNIYGSNENLDAVEFFKHLNSIMKKRNPGVLMIAEDSSLWPEVTKKVEEDGLGFDYKWNMGWTEDMLDYVSTDVGSRQEKHNALTFSLLYAYNEQYMYGFSHKNLAGFQSLLQRIAGNKIQKFATWKVLLGYLMMQPGKKYLCMGQEIGCEQANEKQQLRAYMKDLNALYAAEPALYEEDYEDKGFEWINIMRAKDGILVFTRKTSNADDTLVIICNFSSMEYTNFMIGVPYAGKYKEIFNSDQQIYGGEGNVNGRMRQSKAEECDARENSIVTTIPAFGISVYKYNVAGTVKTVKTAETSKKKTAATTTAKKAAEKKAAATTTAKKTTEKKAAATTTAKKTTEKKAAATTTAKKTTEKKAATATTAKKTAEKKAATTTTAKKAVEKKAATTTTAKKPTEKKDAESDVSAKKTKDTK